jgi:hypothetical protein
MGPLLAMVAVVPLMFALESNARDVLLPAVAVAIACVESAVAENARIGGGCKALDMELSRAVALLMNLISHLHSKTFFSSLSPGVLYR